MVPVPHGPARSGSAHDLPTPAPQDTEHLPSTHLVPVQQSLSREQTLPALPHAWQVPPLHTSWLEQQSAWVEHAEPCLRQHLCEADEQASPLSQQGLTSLSQAWPRLRHSTQRAVSGCLLAETAWQVAVGLPSVPQGQSRALLQAWMHSPPTQDRPGSHGLQPGSTASESQLL